MTMLTFRDVSKFSSVIQLMSFRKRYERKKINPKKVGFQLRSGTTKFSHILIPSFLYGPQSVWFEIFSGQCN